MDKQVLDASVAEPGKANPLRIAPGNERFAFLYVVIAAGALTSAMIYSGLAGLTWWHSVLMVVGAVVLGCAILFSILEVRRIAQTPKEAAKALEEASNPYQERTIVVDPPTGDPYPHHEDYKQSSGFDQGQLTSQLPDATPLIDKLLRRGRLGVPRAAR